MKKFIALILFFACAAVFAAPPFRVIHQMKKQGNEILKGFSVYNHAGHASKLSSTVVDGVPALKLTVSDSKNQWYTRIQLRLTSNAKIEACSEYRIRFRCRTDKVANVRFCCQAAVTPWGMLTEHRPGHVLATPEWQNVEYTFTATKDSNTAAWLPNFECGMLGKGNALYITDLTMEALDAEKTTVIAKPDPQKMQTYCHPGFKISRKNSSFEGSPVCGIHMADITATVKNPSQVHFRFPMTTTVKKGASYRLSFYHKADRKATVQVQVQRATHPWSMISPQALRNFQSDTDWEYFELNFVAAEDYNKIMFLPNIGLGLIGKGNTFYLRDVKFEKID